MIKLKQAVVVEGKYDKIKLSNFIDAPIITTDGFGIFKDKEMRRLLRRLAQTNGLVVLTDSDSAGFLIRRFIGNTVDKERVINAYIPEITGKEKRKQAPSKEGLLGVEGVSEEVILKALTDAGVFADITEKRSDEITKTDLYELGLSGTADSAAKRKKVIEHFCLPQRLTANALLTVLNCITDKEELTAVVNTINGEKI